MKFETKMFIGIISFLLLLLLLVYFVTWLDKPINFYSLDNYTCKQIENSIKYESCLIRLQKKLVHFCFDDQTKFYYYDNYCIEDEK